MRQRTIDNGDATDFVSDSVAGTLRACSGGCGKALALRGRARGQHQYEVAYSEGDRGSVLCRACTEALYQAPLVAFPERLRPSPLFVARLKSRLDELTRICANRSERDERALLEELLALYRSLGVTA